jgi:hypothetical protein
LDSEILEEIDIWPTPQASWGGFQRTATFRWLTFSTALSGSHLQAPAFAENKVTQKGRLGDTFNIELEALTALRRAEFVTRMDDRPGE